MPLPSTHALVPVAAALAMAGVTIPRQLVWWCAAAAAVPDLDGLTNPIFADRWGLSTYSIYAHRGAAHSLFTAFLAACVAALLHKRLGVGRLAAAVTVGLAMASHGLLDMLTNNGRPVAILWPLSARRLFADWRPLNSLPVAWTHVGPQLLVRQQSELVQIIIPMFLAALAIRWIRLAMLRSTTKASANTA